MSWLVHLHSEILFRIFLSQIIFLQPPNRSCYHSFNCGSILHPRSREFTSSKFGYQETVPFFCFNKEGGADCSVCPKSVWNFFASALTQWGVDEWDLTVGFTFTLQSLPSYLCCPAEEAMRDRSKSVSLSCTKGCHRKDQLFSQHWIVSTLVPCWN